MIITVQYIPGMFIGIIQDNDKNVLYSHTDKVSNLTALLDTLQRKMIRFKRNRMLTSI